MLFKSMTDEEKVLFAQICKLKTYKSGDLIVKEGDPGETLIIIRHGKAEVRKGISGSNYKFLKELVDEDFCGDMSYLHKAPRNASVVAIEPCEVLELNATALDNLIVEYPQIGMKFYKNMAIEIAARLKRNNDELKKVSYLILHSLEE